MHYPIIMNCCLFCVQRLTEPGLPGTNGLSAAYPVAMLVRLRGPDTAMLLNHNTADNHAKEKVYRLNHAQLQAVVSLFHFSIDCRNLRLTIYNFYCARQ